jgi:hypothetical protein
MSNQEAKADAGKIRPTLVETDAIRSMARLEEYERNAHDRKVPELVCKTKKEKGNWKGLFICPYCGKNFEANISNVMRGKQHSCGCMKGKFMVESRETHGDTGTRLYRTYRHILERCNTPSCKEYKWYGAKGVKCTFKDYEEFKAFALANGYNDGLTVERIDVNGNYEPSNITFIPQKLQARNTTRSIKITYKGLTLCASEWAEILRFNADTLTKRKRSGWSDERTLETQAGDSIDITLVPIEAIEAIREARLYGTKKYGSVDNWKQVEIERYRDAMYRHLLAYLDDPKSVDEESGIEHYKHMICNCAFICALEREDDATLSGTQY